MAKPNRGRPKLATCSPDDVFRAVTKLGGFEIVLDGAKHTKIRHIEKGIAFTIPRHNPINRYLLRSFVDDVLVAQLGFTEDEVYAHLWC